MPKNEDGKITMLDNEFQGITKSLENVKIPCGLAHLLTAMRIQISKGSDYQFGTIKQAEYYPRGVETMLDTIQSKVLRCRSLIEKYQSKEFPNNEPIQDSLLDIINTASFAIAFINGEMEGQSPERDFLNKEKK